MAALHGRPVLPVARKPRHKHVRSESVLEAFAEGRGFYRISGKAMEINHGKGRFTRARVHQWNRAADWDRSAGTAVPDRG